MRELKFRAWNGSAMEYGGFSIHANGVTLPLESLTKVKTDSPVMQFTGLKDKNGKDIYEGDRVVCDYGEFWAVRFNETGCFVAFNDVEEEYFVFLDDYDFAVIGNIYENPELLENNNE